MKRVVLATLLCVATSIAAAATIGYDGISGLGSTVRLSTDPHYLGYDPAESRVAVSGETVTEVGFHFVSSYPSGQQIEIGVYRKDTLALVGSTTITSTTGVTRTTASVSWPLTAGIEYVIGFRPITDVRTYRVYKANTWARVSALTGSSPLANPFVISANFDYSYAVFATTNAVSSTVCNPISGRCGSAAAPITH